MLEVSTTTDGRHLNHGSPDSSQMPASAQQEGTHIKPDTRLQTEEVGLDAGIDLEKADELGVKSVDISRSPSEKSHDEPPRSIVSFARNDPANPYSWSATKKFLILLDCILLVLNSTIGSSIASGVTQETAKEFNVTDKLQLVLPTSLYLVGYVLGPLFFAPLSESYGRKWTMTVTFVMYTAFALGSALAPSWPGLNVMRLLCGMGASTPISVVGGIYADIYNTPKARGRAMSFFMSTTVFGPLLGPIASGYVGVVSWRWAYWVQLILAGVTWPFFILMPETFGPILLRKKARQMRKETGNSAFVAPIELEKQDLRELLTVVLTRPLVMFFTEAIVFAACMYMALLYALFYIYLQAYPIIFQGIYGFNAGEEGLTFLPIGVGAVLACGIYLWWDHYMDTKRAESPPPEWTKQEEYRRVPLGCFAGPFLIVSMFWLGWTARADVHYIVPVLAALPFGIAYLLIFMALMNYIVDAYEVFAASAMAASSCSRSLFGVVLPFAAAPMFERLGVAWACSLLGFVSLAMAVIPFVFIRYGDYLRANSKFCQELKRRKEEQEAERMMEER